MANARGEGKLIFVSTPPSVKGEIRAVAKDWPATTAGRMRGLECLARLAAAFGAHERSSSVARMEQHIVGMLTGELATARLAGAHLLTSWLRVVPPGPQRPTLQAPGAQLGAILANTNPAYPSAPSPTPYGEVAQMVKYVKSESMAFLRVAATNGVVVTGEVPSPEADGFGADSAATLSAAVPQVRFTRSIFSRFGVRARRRRRLHVRSAPRALCAWYFMRFHHMGLVSRASDERLRRVQLLHKNEAHRFPQS